MSKLSFAKYCLWTLLGFSCNSDKGSRQVIEGDYFKFESHIKPSITTLQSDSYLKFKLDFHTFEGYFIKKNQPNQFLPSPCSDYSQNGSYESIFKRSFNIHTIEKGDQTLIDICIDDDYSVYFQNVSDDDLPSVKIIYRSMQVRDDPKNSWES
ncbi:MAG: hypothetical protein MRY83_19595 [Flavobacteriales bacterium]|nr:hypothetical protein [Flavobacteriales bacterium]